MKEIIAYKAVGKSKKYHLEHSELSVAHCPISKCVWHLDSKTAKNIVNIKEDQLCKICFKKHLNEKKTRIEVKAKRINNRFEILDL